MPNNVIQMPFPSEASGTQVPSWLQRINLVRASGLPGVLLEFNASDRVVVCRAGRTVASFLPYALSSHYALAGDVVAHYATATGFRIAEAPRGVRRDRSPVDEAQRRSRLWDPRRAGRVAASRYTPWTRRRADPRLPGKPCAGARTKRRCADSRAVASGRGTASNRR